MPIQLTWQPSKGPKMKQVGGRSFETQDITERGLEIRGEEAQLAGSDPAKPNVVDGRIRLVETADKGKEAGKSEPATRTVATFHGKFHSNPAAPRSERVTFEIFIGKASVGPHDQAVQGFDPECIFGVDGIVLTFVNREFVIFFPFHVDTDREGSFLELQAIAEIGAIGSATEIAKSSILSVGIRRTHAVDTTSALASGPLQYTGEQVGNVVLTPEGYMLHGGVKNASSTASDISLDPALLDVHLPNPAVTFAPYVAGKMQVLLLVDLLDDLPPPDSFLTSNVGGVTAGNLVAVRSSCVQHFRGLQAVVESLFVDAGFAGVKVMWSDEPAAATLLAAFKGAFIFRTLGGRAWGLKNTKAPLDTGFWNFFIGSSNKNQTAGQGEIRAESPVAKQINGKEFFVGEPFPIGGGNKLISQPAEIASSVFQNLLMDFSGLPRKYATIADFEAATDKVAAKLAILIAHEIAHSLGQMHHNKVTQGANYSEKFGSPVLSIMSSDVESNGFGIGIKFGAQTKVVWATAFGVSNQPDDTFLQNKVWTDAEIFTMTWGDRTNKFLKKHGEGSMARISLDSGQTPPPFAKAPPDAQRGTFKP